MKVLDFGLAKAMEGASGSGSGADAQLSHSPTLTHQGTQAGMILGTAAYMSPEQARGRKVDRRADIWSFGVVLFEMLTGNRLFTGETVSDVLAAVLTRDPDWSALSPRAQPSLSRLVRRCLERDPKRRLRDIGEARFWLDDDSVALGHPSQAEPAPTPTPTMRRARVPWAIAAFLGLVAVGLAVSLLRRPAPDALVIRTMIPPPEGASFDFDATVGPAVLSPNGRLVAFSARGAERRVRLWVRPLDSATARPIEGADGASFPFWAPDSRALGYYSNARGRLERVDLEGGAPVAVARAGFVRGATWSTDNSILYDASDLGGCIMEVPIGGGAARKLRAISAEGAPKSPWALPDGRHFLYVLGGRVHVGSRVDASDSVVTEASSNVMYADGSLLFMREDALLAQRFDLKTLSVTGTPAAIARDVQSLLGDIRGVFSASDTGLLLYLDGAAASAATLAWFDGSGRRLATVGEMGRARGVRLSPDERAASVGIAEADGNIGLWRVDLETGVRNRVTPSAGVVGDHSGFSAWSPDGRDLAYGIKEGDRVGIARSPANGGSQEVLATFEPSPDKIGHVRVTDWTPAGGILYSRSNRGGVEMLRLGAKDRAPVRIVADPDAQNIRVSPNQRFMLHQSRPAGASAGVVTIEAFPAGGRKIEVTARGTLGVWGTDGRAVYYAEDDILTVAEVQEAEGALRLGVRRAIMPIIIGRGFSYDVAKDGRILALVTQSSATRPLTLVQQWTASMQER